MKIEKEITKKRLAQIIAYAEYLEFFCKKAPLIDDFQKASTQIRKFLYELDINDVIDKPQWKFDKEAILNKLKGAENF